ncbi:MAG: DNA internalization-related competence protein ComEC/Rec2 [Chloroflexi bacterium]|nr:DNA internalization-related competence protein ComEC/Rec2 [Chloroflexota bacterium]
MLLVYVGCAWVAGIWLGSKLHLPPLFLLSGLIPFCLLLPLRRRRRLIIAAGLGLLSLLSGMAWGSRPPDPSRLQLYNDRGKVELRGIVSKAPEVRDRTTHIYLAATEIKTSGTWQKTAGTALLIVPRYGQYAYGAVLEVAGTPEMPPRLDDFDYRGYLAHQGIYTIIYYPKLTVLETGRGSPPLAWIYALRERLSGTLAEVLPEPQASLAQGILLGMRGNIPQEVRDDFARSGTTHILVISGHNLTIVTGILLSLGVWLLGRRRFLHVWPALAIIWLYTLLTGASPPVVRSAIMASLFLLAEVAGRQKSAGISLVFAAAVMVGISPPVLWDASFQLTVLAMAGLIYVAPPLQSAGKRLIQARLGEAGPASAAAGFAVDSFAVTLGTLIAVWPVIAYYFGFVSLVAPVATVLVLPVLPAIIVTGGIAVGTGLFFLPLGQVVAWLAWLFLSYMLLVVKEAAALPLAYIRVDEFNPVWLWPYYIVLVAAYWAIRKGVTFSNMSSRVTQSLKSGLAKSGDFIALVPRKWVMPPLVVLAVIAVLTAANMPDGRLRVSFLDIGQGDAILVQQGSRQVLVDGGPSPQAINLQLGKVMPFWDRTIELVILTHPHSDHLAGLLEVLRRYRVQQVLYPDLVADSPEYREWRRLIEAEGASVAVAQAGQQISLGEVSLAVLNPQSRLLQGTESDIDDNGVVLRLSKGKVSFLLTADITAAAELELLANRADVASTVLKVGHHGSETSTSQVFLNVVRPQIAVISAGKDNPYGHPHQDVLGRLQQDEVNIYRTDAQGTIKFTTDGERLWVKTER